MLAIQRFLVPTRITAPMPKPRRTPVEGSGTADPELTLKEPMTELENSATLPVPAEPEYAMKSALLFASSLVKKAVSAVVFAVPRSVAMADSEARKMLDHPDAMVALEMPLPSATTTSDALASPMAVT